MANLPPECKGIAESQSNETNIFDFPEVVDEFETCSALNWWVLLMLSLFFVFAVFVGVAFGGHALKLCLRSRGDRALLDEMDDRGEVFQPPPLPPPPLPTALSSQLATPLPPNSQPRPPDECLIHEGSHSKISDSTDRPPASSVTNRPIQLVDKDDITDAIFKSHFSPSAPFQAIDGSVAIPSTSVLIADPKHREAAISYRRQSFVVLKDRALKRVDSFSGELLVGLGQDSKAAELVGTSGSHVTTKPPPVPSEESDHDVNRRLLHGQEQENVPFVEGKSYQVSSDRHKGNSAFVGLQYHQQYVTPPPTLVLPNPSPNTANVAKRAPPVGNDLGCAIHSEGYLLYFQCAVEQSDLVTDTVDTTDTVTADNTDTTQVNTEPTVSSVTPTEASKNGTTVREDYPCAFDYQDLLVAFFVA